MSAQILELVMGVVAPELCELKPYLLSKTLEVIHARDRAGLEFLRQATVVARGFSADARLTEIADPQIGQMLVGAKEHDGQWPPDAVCAIIDQLQSEPLDEGFHSAIMNSRGVFSKDPLEGGAQEQGLAAKYAGLADKVRDRFPHTAFISGAVAEDCRRHARREDDEAELREDLDA